MQGSISTQFNPKSLPFLTTIINYFKICRFSRVFSFVKIFINVNHKFSIFWSCAVGAFLFWKIAEFYQDLPLSDQKTTDLEKNPRFHLFFSKNLDSKTFEFMKNISPIDAVCRDLSIYIIFVGRGNFLFNIFRKMFFFGVEMCFQNLLFFNTKG